MMALPRILDGRRRGLWLRLVGNGLAQAVAAVATTLLIRHVFDRWLTAPRAALPLALAWIGAALVALALSRAWLRMRERTDAELLGQDYVYRVRLAIFDRLGTLAPRVLQRRRRGSLMLRFVGDLSALRQWVSLGLARLSVAGVTAGVALAALAYLNPTLAGAISLTLAGGVATALAVATPLRAAVRESRRRQALLAANVNEKIAAMTVVQLCGQIRRERRHVAHQGQRLRDAMVARARISGWLRAITEATGALAVAVVVVLGALEVASGRTTPGTVVGAMTIVGLLLPALRDLGRTHEYAYGFRVASERLQRFLELPSLVSDYPGAPDLALVRGRLELRQASVGGVFEGLNATALAGGRIAIVGPNGAGKSTLLALAARLLDPDRGTVLLDSQDLAQHSLASVRQAVGMVSAELPLLKGTIAKNLRYRWPDAPDQEVARVCALCGVDELLAELPEGAQTRLLEDGKNLSPGQRQRIALARALLGQPALLLLDEVEAHLDLRASGVIDRILAHYDGTVLMVTHHRDRLFQADEIWHMADGRLVETGPPLKLLNSDGPTRRLFGAIPWTVNE
ncbi:MAG: ABC transporter ATP-binding protein [Candidatus Competibacteraceae bacterium]|nr:ABC transporter ATP-binding protein [Candidatus Competibacteraceae bacterium]MBK7983485.1 ABC transporter ATP-binding protein [Candidatus Competibacteraceae bacterium]MBK8897974.1 ABC transporter ATP-binding protein [Candidatus Competibacteraceae bacterium]MBK8961778.1 ABC transporter ATP-binding protein [Candidatus Competibacteraceae bacterium]MBK9950994.1 ABC transporter ATP-binding protein [Candidatus Competibacteraceae bacterium]